MLDNPITYGFVDENNILINTAVIIENDIETIERIKVEFNATAAYPMDLTKELTWIGNTFWNGTRFIPPKPIRHPSFIWSEEENMWVHPIPRPSDREGYTWDEELQQWT